MTAAGALAIGATTIGAVAIGMVAASAPTLAAPIAAYEIVGDAIPAPLGGLVGDPARGRAIVANRQVGMCLLCHAGPFPEERFQGNLGPDLAGVGARYTPAQLRLRVVASRRLNPASVMPETHRVDGLARVGAAWRERPILDAQQVEDVVALLATLRP